MAIAITGLFVSPVVSCHPIAVKESRVMPWGLEWDRRWMIVDAQKKRMSQKEFPQLALIRPRFEKYLLVLHAPDFPELGIPLAGFPGGDVMVQPDDDSYYLAVDQGAAAALWLSTVIGTPCSLVFMPPIRPRYRRSDTLKREICVSFAWYPIHIASEESLADLNTVLEEAIPMDRFRPTIVVKGATTLIEDIKESGCRVIPAAYQEEEWGLIEAGENVWMEFIKKTERCGITCVDQETGTREKGSNEPLGALMRTRPETKKPIFGAYYRPHTLGTIRKGDPIRVVFFR